MITRELDIALGTLSRATPRVMRITGSPQPSWGVLEPLCLRPRWSTTLRLLQIRLAAGVCVCNEPLIWFMAPTRCYFDKEIEKCGEIHSLDRV